MNEVMVYAFFSLMTIQTSVQLLQYWFSWSNLANQHWRGQSLSAISTNLFQIWRGIESHDWLPNLDKVERDFLSVNDQEGVMLVQALRKRMVTSVKKKRGRPRKVLVESVDTNE